MTTTAEIHEWFDQRLPDAQPYEHALKVCEEAGELASCLIHGSTGDPAEEAADVYIALQGYCHKSGIDLNEAVLAKLRILWCR